MSNRRIALIPAYEPDRALLEITEELKKCELEIIVIDDGSGKNFEDLFTEAGRAAKILQHDTNRGKGAAIKTGLSYIAEHYRPPYTVVTVDADGQHRPADVMRVLQAADEERTGIVLGSRSFTGAVPLRSRIGNGITRLVYRLISGCRIYDTQTGLRAFSDLLLPELLQIEGERYEYEMNALIKLAKKGCPLREVRIETVYLNDNASSHFDTFRDSFRICKEILKFSAASLAGFLVDYSLYCVLTAATGDLVLSNVAARIVSATANYTLNRKLVFRSNVPVARSVAQYAALAVVILIGNTVVLRGLTCLGWNHYLAKIVTELAFFAFSWIVQRSLVFRRKEVNYEKA